MRSSIPLLEGTAIALLTAGTVELCALAFGRFDSPPPILALAVVIAAYRGATRSGLACAILLLAYAFVAWRLPGGGWTYANEMPFRLGLLALGLPLVAVLVGFLKTRSDAQFEEVVRSENGMRDLHAELTKALASRQRILDQSMDMICTANAAGQFTMVSAACERILGYTPEQMVGRLFMDLVHPDDHERTTQVAVEIMLGVHTQDFVNRYIRSDGSCVHVMWSSTWVAEDQLMYAVARDYSEQHAVNDERSRYVAIIEATTDLVAMSWSDGRISYVNRAGRELLGIGLVEDVSQLEVSDLSADWAAKLLVGHAANDAMDEGVSTSETQLHPRSGESIPVSQIVLSHRDANGRLQFMSTIARDISAIKALETRLREEACTDELTGLFNRRHFMERFGAALHAAKRRGHLLSLAMCDLDGFKLINDSYGHTVGDKVLQAVGKILGEEVRGEDVAGRYGGDEFCLMFPHVSAQQAMACLERIRNRVSQLRFPTQSGSVAITMSFGIVDLSDTDSSVAWMIEGADKALYRAKSAGRNRVGSCSTPLDRAIQSG